MGLIAPLTSSNVRRYGGAHYCWSLRPRPPGLTLCTVNRNGRTGTSSTWWRAGSSWPTSALRAAGRMTPTAYGRPSAPRSMTSSSSPRRYVRHCSLFGLVTLIYLFYIYIFICIQIAASGSKAQVEYLASIKEGKAQEDCLVDNWVGHARCVSARGLPLPTCIVAP
jgi:hypothetical protein